MVDHPGVDTRGRVPQPRRGRAAGCERRDRDEWSTKIANAAAKSATAHWRPQTPSHLRPRVSTIGSTYARFTVEWSVSREMVAARCSTVNWVRERKMVNSWHTINFTCDIAALVEGDDGELDQPSRSRGITAQRRVHVNAAGVADSPDQLQSPRRVALQVGSTGSPRRARSRAVHSTSDLRDGDLDAWPREPT